MFSNLLKKLTSKFERAVINPSAFNDPVALKTDWTPLRNGGTSFKANQLYQISPTRWEFRASLGMKLFCALFVMIGVGTCIAAVVGHWAAAEASWDLDFFFVGGIGLVFTLIGSWMYYAFSIPVVFDKEHGYFTKSRKKPEPLANYATLEGYTQLRKIHALQLLEEHCRGDKSSYYSYELNLVLADGSRLNVVDHGNLIAVRNDANALGKFLGKPVWDVI